MFPIPPVRPERLIDSQAEYSYIIAIMRYEIIVSPEAIEDLKRLSAHNKAKAKDSIEVHVRYKPTMESKSRIKKLKGLAHPQYRLRVDEIRVFYDVAENKVEVLAIILKSEAQEWLKRQEKIK